jgi:toxin YoeB
MRVIFSEQAFAEYTDWLAKDPKIYARINELIKDILKNGMMKGIGKPEALRHRDGFSRRINREHRLVYEGNKDRDLVIISCEGHYRD